MRFETSTQLDMSPPEMISVSHSQLPPPALHDERPTKRVKLLLEDEDEDEDVDRTTSSTVSGGVALNASRYGKDGLKGLDFKVNEEYARRFEHNQRRAEIHRCRPKIMLGHI